MKVGDHVKHPACPDGAYPAGTGEVVAVDKDGKCKIRCDKTSEILPDKFEEDDLELA